MPKKSPRRSTIDAPAPGHEDMRPTASIPVPTPLPTVPEELPETVDNLPARGSACRRCGVRTRAESRFGGVMRFDPTTASQVPSDATNVRQVRVQVGPDRVYDSKGNRIAPGFAVVTQFTVPLWRFCDDCEPLANDERPVTLLESLLGTPLKREPTELAVAATHAPTPFYQLPDSAPSDRGSSRPWKHVPDDAIEASRVELRTLVAHGGAPHPTGKPCGICGRTNSPYGWRENLWWPLGAGETPTRVPVCGGYRNVHNPKAPSFMRWSKELIGCETLADAPRNGLSSPPEEIVWRSAAKAGAQLPCWSVHQLADMRRVMAWKHPEYSRVNDVRAPWWHVADAPLAPLSMEDQLAERIARLEAELTKGVAI